MARELDQLWTATGPNEGGFHSVFDFRDGPSLYVTAWDLKLARRMQLPLNGLSKTKTAAWLSRVIHDPMWAPAGMNDGLPALENVWLAVTALAALNAPIPSSVVQTDLHRLATGDMYSLTPGGAGSWAATEIALATMDACGCLEAPAGLSAAVGAQLVTLSNRGSALNTSTIENVVVPVWEISDAVLAPDERANYGSLLQNELSQIAALAASSANEPAFATSLEMGASLVARANGVPFEPSMAPILADGLTAQGYVSLSPNAPEPDPQLTYQAIELGLAVPASLATTLEGTVGSLGWYDLNPVADPETSFYALEIERAIGISSHVSDLRVETETWASGLAREDLALAGSSTLKRAYFVVALANALGVALHGSEVSALTSAAASVGGRWLVVSLALEAMIGSAPPATVISALSMVAESGDRNQMVGAYEQQLLAWATGRAVWRKGAVVSARRFAFRSTYRATMTAATPDILSAAIGATILGLSEPGRAQAIAPFQSVDGSFRFPASQTNGNLLSPLTVYLGYVALGQVADLGGLAVALLHT